MTGVPALMFALNLELILTIKELKFRPVFLVNGSGAMARVVVGVGVVLMWQSVWEIVLSHVAAQAGRLLASFIFLPVRVRFRWDLATVGRHLRYGWQIMATGVSQYLFCQGDRWFVGKVMGEGSLASMPFT